jgi:hypothetical protein
VRLASCVSRARDTDRTSPVLGLKRELWQNV